MALWLLVGTQVAGCILVHTTEHRVRLNSDGSGEALLRLIDIRSDALTDSSVAYDFRVMMEAFHDSSNREFEQEGRTVKSKQFVVAGDTLIAEIAYTFTDIRALTGMRETADELYVVVGADRAIVKTNGRVETGKDGATRIVWPRDAERLQYEICERFVPPSTSLASRYKSEIH